MQNKTDKAFSRYSAAYFSACFNPSPEAKRNVIRLHSLYLRAYREERNARRAALTLS